jgi:hypothetical protein
LSKKIRNTKKRKSYSRVYDLNTKHRIYNKLQLSELSEANRIYSYEIDFSQNFKYSLCSTYHNLMARLKKSQTTKTIPTNPPKTYKSNTKSYQASRLTRSNSSAKNSREINSNDNNVVVDENDDDENNDDDEVDEVEEINEVEFEKNLMNNEEDDGFQDIEEEVDNSEIEESEDEHVEISFKLVIRREGKNSAAKWETIYQTNFDNFMKDLYILIQDQVDELVLHNDCVISYRNSKGSGIGTHLSGERDWKMFLKEYQKLNSQEREMMIIANLKLKPNKITKR